MIHCLASHGFNNACGTVLIFLKGDSQEQVKCNKNHKATRFLQAYNFRYQNDIELLIINEKENVFISAILNIKFNTMLNPMKFFNKPYEFERRLTPNLINDFRNYTDILCNLLFKIILITRQKLKKKKNTRQIS